MDPAANPYPALEPYPAERHLGHCRAANGPDPALPGPCGHWYGAAATPCRSPRESVDVLPNGPGDTENPQDAGPGDQGDRAGAWRQEMIDSQAQECVRSTGWGEPPDRWGEAEQEVVDDEAPGEKRDDCADLVVDDRAEAGADRAPQGRAGEPAEREQKDVAAAEDDGDATPVEGRVAGRPADCLPEDPEGESGQCPGDGLGGQDA